MVKYTQTIRRLLPANCLSVFDYFVGSVLKRVKSEMNDGLKAFKELELVK